MEAVDRRQVRREADMRAHSPLSGAVQQQRRPGRGGIRIAARADSVAEHLDVGFVDMPPAGDHAFTG